MSKAIRDCKGQVLNPGDFVEIIGPGLRRNMAKVVGPVNLSYGRRMQVTRDGSTFHYQGNDLIKKEIEDLI